MTYFEIKRYLDKGSGFQKIRFSQDYILPKIRNAYLQYFPR